MSDGCATCFQEEGTKANVAIGRTIASIKQELERLLSTVPIVTLHAPPRWDFTVIGIATAQSVSGTGVFSDVTSAFTDLFGAQSGAYNSKLRAGEDLCRSSLRAQAFQAGGNAILGVDVDYAEVGGSRAMLMVCMAGTVVRIHNPDVISPAFAEDMAAFEAHRERLTSLTLVARKRGLVVQEQG